MGRGRFILHMLRVMVYWRRGLNSPLKLPFFLDAAWRKSRIQLQLVTSVMTVHIVCAEYSINIELI